MGKALKHYERAVELQPANINFVKNLADFYYVEVGRIEDALMSMGLRENTVLVFTADNGTHTGLEYPYQNSLLISNFF